MAAQTWRSPKLGAHLLVVAGFVVSVVLILRGFIADDNDFQVLAGWANIIALPVGVLGIALVVREKTLAARDTSPTRLADVADSIAKELLARESEERARLIGTDEVATTHANLEFVRDFGRFREVGGDASGTMDSVRTYFEDLHPQRLTILGKPGAGKTVLALELIIQLLQRRTSTDPVPVRLAFASWDTGKGFDAWIVDELVDRFRLDRRIATVLVRDRWILPVVDGLDEMDPDDAPPERSAAAVAKLNGYVRAGERAPLIVTCRQGFYERLGSSVASTHVEILDLTAPEIVSYLRSHVHDLTEELAWLQVLDEVERPGSPLAQLLGTPWQLTLATTVYRAGGNPAELIPKQGEPDYEGRVKQLLLERYVPSAVSLHGGYDADQVMGWLVTIAEHLDWRSRNTMSGTDIVLHTWWPVGGPNRVRFWHAAVTLGVMFPALGLLWRLREGPIDVWTHKIRHFFEDFADLSPSFMAGGIGVVVLTGIVLLVALNNALSWDPMLYQVRLRDLRSAEGLRSLLSSLFIGATLGLIIWLLATTSQIVPWQVEARVSPYIWLCCGLLLGVFIWLGFNSTTGDGQSGPRIPLRTSGVWSLGISSLIALASTLPMTLAYGPLVGAAGALACFALGTMFTSGAWVRYHVTLVIAARRKGLPLRFGTFLDWAWKAGILRVSGIGYQFRHRELQRWLTPAG
ncbi:NACHT domain-containing protein [Lentzea tibetensis]|uniref:NACHT domain-containing protein n=1 Tax=Lentzea tibetensis TaxID=2591470 RepID=UPI001F23B825|nr:NACHT domain-containing protein [Lentzea tibetensis]